MFPTTIKELLVDKCIDVLNVFYTKQNEELWPNKIVKEIEKTTGSRDKPAIINAIGLLEKAFIIETERTITKHKQKEIKVPTELAKEILDFIDVFGRSYDSYTKLKDKIIEHNFKVRDNNDYEIIYNIVKNQLRNKGWDLEEIRSFASIMESAFKMETFYRKNILTYVLNRYSKIKNEYNVNEIANKIILKIFMTRIEKIFLIVEELEDTNDKYFSNPNYYFNAEYSDDLPFVDMSLLLVDDIQQLYRDGLNLMNQNIANNIDEVTLSLILLAQPSSDDLKDEVTEDEEYEIPTQDSIISELKKDSIKSRDEQLSQLGNLKLMDIYRKYIQLKQV